jgi:hypothetical protein
MNAVDYTTILDALKAERHQTIAKLSGASQPPDAATLRRLADMQAAIAAIEADEQDSLPAGQR